MKKFLLLLGAMLLLASPAFSQENAVFREISAIATGERSVGNIIDSVADSINSIWSYRITTMDRQPIAVSNVIIGILLFIFGMWFSKYLSHFIGRRLHRLFNLEQSVTAALEKFSYYLFVVLMALLVLDISNVPLKVFTFVGGALAIGIGFGSQNIINNFISGLILLVERPIKIGDLVEVNNTVGKVISIGARCTHLRTGGSVDILVPNSTMLEKMVVNWTFDDDIIRATIPIGVAYGTPTEKVESVLLSALNQTDYVLSDPAPQVYFIGFGESTLNFEVFLWVDLSGPVEKNRIVSNLNHTINRLCHENGIVFAYPQRDVNLKINKTDKELVEKIAY